jgi:hypothetical protein
MKFDRAQMRGETTATFPTFKILYPQWGIWQPELHAFDNYIVSNRPWDLDRGGDKLIIMSDVVKHHRVANQSRQVLAVIPVPRGAKFGETITAHFNSPFYFPISQQSIDKIEIVIRDREGRDINFHNGSVVVILSIKRPK